MLTRDQRECLRLLANSPHGSVGCEDNRLDRFCDDAVAVDVLNQCFNAGLARQSYDTSSDSGHVYITPEGRAALAEVSA